MKIKIKLMAVGVPLLFLIITGACKFENPAEGLELRLNIDVQRPIFSGTLTADPEIREVVSNATLPSQTRASRWRSSRTRVALAMSDTLVARLGVIPREVYQFFKDRQGSPDLIATFLGGVVQNLADNEITIDYYFSWVPDTADLATEAEWIANITLDALETDTLEVDSDYTALASQQTFLDFLDQSSAEGDSLYLYIRAFGDPNLDLHVPAITIFFPPIAWVSELINPGDLTDYKLRLMRTSEIIGYVTNEGDAPANFSLYLSIIDGDYVMGHPDVLDLVGQVTVPPDSTVDLSMIPFIIPATRDHIGQCVDALFEDIQVEANMLCASLEPILVHCVDMEIVAGVTVGVSEED